MTTIIVMIMSIILIVICLAAGRKRKIYTASVKGTDYDGDGTEYYFEADEKNVDVNVEDVKIIKIKSDDEIKQLIDERRARNLLREHDCVKLMKQKQHLENNIRNHEKVNDIEHEIYLLNKKLRTPKPGIHTGFTLTGVALIISGLILCLIGAVMFVEIIDGPANVLIVSGLLCLTLGIILIVIARSDRKKRIKIWEADMQNVRQTLQEKQLELKAAQEKADEYVRCTLKPYIEEITEHLLPLNYASDYRMVSRILDYMISMRAYTTAEAINLYYEERFRDQMLHAASNMADSVRRTAMAAERSAEASERAAAAAAAAAASGASTAASMKRVANASERQARASETVANNTAYVANKMEWE